MCFKSEEDFLRLLIQQVVQQVLEAEMDAAVGAQKGERTPDRLGYRSGYYSRTLMTVSVRVNFQLPTSRAPMMNPSSISVRRDRPRHMTVLPGGGSFVPSQITTQPSDLREIARERCFSTPLARFIPKKFV